MDFNFKKYKFTQKWFHEKVPVKTELHKHIDLLKPLTILEIGNFEGLSSCFFSDNYLDHEESRLYCVDPYYISGSVKGITSKCIDKNTEQMFIDNIKKSKHYKKITKYKMTSDEYFETNEIKFDIIYLDGCHQPDYIERDLNNSFKFIKEDGVIWINSYKKLKYIRDMTNNYIHVIYKGLNQLGIKHYDINNIDILNNHYYINLDHREDRNKDIIKLLTYIGIEEPRRFPAIKQKNGALGCSMSHLECLKLAKKNKYPYVVMLEDDIELSSHTSKSIGKWGSSCNIIEQDIQTRIKDVIDKKFDVLFLGGNNIGNCEKIDPNNNYIKINNCQTTTAYIVKEHYYDTLLQNIEESINLLSKTGSNHYCIDMYFKKLQKKDEWWFMTPPIFIQKDDYSDIQKKHVNYINQLEIW
jgi:glycosyl transferase family 25